MQPRHLCPKKPLLNEHASKPHFHPFTVVQPRSAHDHPGKLVHLIFNLIFHLKHWNFIPVKHFYPKHKHAAAACFAVGISILLRRVIYCQTRLVRPRLNSSLATAYLC